MIVNMLEAISEMISIDGPEDMKDVATRVRCAKIMLDKVIDGLKEKPELMPAFHYKKALEAPEVKIQNHKEKVEPEYQINVEHGKLIFMKINKNGEWVDAPHDTPMVIDEIVTTYGEAIGKPFQNGQVL